ncbi:unnamed protein product [Pelagomonas calceolata]|uniref:Bromo domain-containing protein n=1 Tax=Pelagomonas calceolata TaxID=35677 RepID=A0A8J2SZ63_9STRA|nr:unnamed protein product [Pelagomonas calceolata]
MSTGTYLKPFRPPGAQARRGQQRAGPQALGAAPAAQALHVGLPLRLVEAAQARDRRQAGDEPPRQALPRGRRGAPAHGDERGRAQRRVDGGRLGAMGGRGQGRGRARRDGRLRGDRLQRRAHGRGLRGGRAGGQARAPRVGRGRPAGPAPGVGRGRQARAPGDAGRQRRRAHGGGGVRGVGAGRALAEAEAGEPEGRGGRGPAPAPPTKEAEPQEPEPTEPPAAPTKETEQTPEQRAACLGACDGVLKYLLRHKHAAWFADPVDPVGMGIPHYAEIIKQPMDFGTIKGKYKGGRYASAEAFAADVRLVFRNATTFNTGADEPVHVAAVQLGAKFEERFESAMEDALYESSDDEEEEEEEPARRRR